MDDIRRLIARFEPVGLRAEGPGWQQRKSSQTRIAILDAAINCLAQHGYARKTTQLIAEMAGISRGAMLHHYPTKGALIEAIIAYSFYKRVEMLADGVERMIEDQRVKKFTGLEILWESFFTPEYKAYVELNIASRTDAEVRATFIPQARRFSRIWREEGIRIFPEWAGNPDRLVHASDLAESVMEGMALNIDVWNDADRVARMRHFLRRSIGMIYAGELSFQDVSPAPPASGGLA